MSSELQQTELESIMHNGFQKTMTDSRREFEKLQAKQRVCATCVGQNNVIAKEDYSEVEWAKPVGESRCSACIWRENYNASFH